MDSFRRHAGHLEAVHAAFENYMLHGEESTINSPRQLLHMEDDVTIFPIDPPGDM